jgi:hypothetical protein
MPTVLAKRPRNVVNRLWAVLLHVPYYSSEGLARLSEDTGFSKSALSRLARGQSQPTPFLMRSIVEAISKRSRQRLATAEIFSSDGTYPTPSTCALLGCSGCFPPGAWNENTDTLRRKWKHQKPGDWCRFPLAKGCFFEIPRSQETGNPKPCERTIPNPTGPNI